MRIKCKVVKIEEKKKIKAKRKCHTCKLTGSPPSAPPSRDCTHLAIGIISLR